MFGNTERQISLILAQQELLMKETEFLKKQTTNILDEFKNLLQITKLMNADLTKQEDRLDIVVATQKDIDSCKGITDKLKAAKIHSGPGSVA